MSDDTEVGDVINVRMYDRALTAEEVAALYERDLEEWRREYEPDSTERPMFFSNLRQAWRVLVGKKK